MWFELAEYFYFGCHRVWDLGSNWEKKGNYEKRFSIAISSTMQINLGKKESKENNVGMKWISFINLPGDGYE